MGEDINGRAKEEIPRSVQSSTDLKQDKSLNMNRYFQDPSKRQRENLDDSSDSEEEPHISRCYLRKFKKREEELKVQILQLEHESACHAAIARQYRTKVKKMRTMAMAAITNEDNIIEKANDEFENGTVNAGPVDSDPEDKKITNTVAYSYVDNELFTNEE